MDQVPAALVTKWFWEAGCCAAGKKENDGDSNSGALLASDARWLRSNTTWPRN